MMRTYDALGFDPAPGDTGRGQELARRLRSATRALEQMDAVVSGTGDQQWQGRAAEAFGDLVDADLKPRVREAYLSFAEASSALDTWLEDLTVFQDRAAALEQEAQQARAALASAQSDADRLGDAPDDPDDPDAAADHRAKVKAAQGLVTARSGALQEIIDRATVLAEQATVSANHTAEKLQKAGDAAPDKPGLWDRISDALSDLGDLLADIVEFVHENWWDLLHYLVNLTANVLTIAAIFVPALAPFALAFSIADVLMSGIDWARGVPGAREAFLEGAIGLIGGFAVGKMASAFVSAAGPALMTGPFQVVMAGGGGAGAMAAPAVAALAYNPKYGPALAGYVLVQLKDAKDVGDALESLLGGNNYYSGSLANGWRRARSN